MPETLARVIGDLDLLNNSTEQDFLKIGGKLTEFFSAVKLISSGLTALANLLSGEQGQSASQALTNALDRSMEMAAQADEGNRVLGGMRQQAEQLKRTLAGFKSMVSTFHTLGVLIRIETSRLGSAGSNFGNLSDDVKALAADIERRVENAVDTAALLIPPIASALQTVSALEEGQAKNLPSVITSVRASLSSFREVQETAHASAVRLRAQSDAISDAFSKLIVSIQFHDITRQQIEHVSEMLRRLCSESGEQNSGVSSNRRDMAAVLALQSSQLAGAAKTFAFSVDSIAHSLDDVARHVLEMSDESATLSGPSADEKDSSLSQMEQGCSAILASFGACAKAEAATRATSVSLFETIGRMRSSIEEIQAIEIQMQRMGMNASVQASHIGEAGDALGVLASTMQQLELDSRQRSHSLVEILGSTSQAATQLSKRGAREQSASEEDCVEALRIAVADLHSSSERSFAQIADIVTSSARLRHDLSATRQSFSVGALFAETVSGAREMLKEIGEELQSGSSRDGAESPKRGLAAYGGHYTMQAERDVHEGLTKLNTAVTPEQSELTSVKAAELEDNVELF